MGTPAWQVREMERQQLLEDITQKAWEFAESKMRLTDDRRLLASLVYWILIGLDLQNSHEPFIAINPHVEKYLTEVFLKVESFSRTEAEKKALLARLVEKHLVPAIMSQFYGDLQREEVSEPWKIFGTLYATDEIDLP